MIIYVAGPVSGMPLDNRPAFEEAREALLAAGYLALVPHDVVAPGTEWGTAMRATVAAMMGCGGVALLPGWQASRGAKVERDVAQAVGITVKGVAGWLEEARA